MSMITWNTAVAPNGGDWDTGTNWVGDSVPGVSDTAVIKNLTGSGIVSLSSNKADSVSGLTTDSSVSLEVINGSLSLTTASTSTFGGPVMIVNGASMSFGAGANLTLGSGQTLQEDGTLTFATGDQVVFQRGYAEQIVVNGTMTATGTTFPPPTPAAPSRSTPTWRLTASGCTFSITQVALDSSSILDSGDLTNNVFNGTSLALPWNFVPLIAQNASFSDIDINPGTMFSGTLALDAIGTNTANLSYVFPGGFTIASGAAVNVGANVMVVISSAQTITDNGTLSFATGDQVVFQRGYAEQIVVNGTMTATGTTFSATNTGGSVQVNANAHLTASGCTFSITQVALDSSSILNSGDLTNNVFNGTSLALPWNFVPLIAQNASFSDIDINPGTMPSGTLALDAIGTNTANLSYVFPGGFTIASGASVNVGSNVSLSLPSGQSINVNGALTFATGDQVTFQEGDPEQIVVGVNGTGTMNATGTVFSGGYGSIQVDSGGDLVASNCPFTLSIITLGSGAALR